MTMTRGKPTPLPRAIDLAEMVHASSADAVAAQYGVSEQTVRQHLNWAGFDKHGNPITRRRVENIIQRTWPGAWVRQARCGDADPNIFFSDVGSSPQEMEALRNQWCRPCPVATQCLKWAIENHKYGIWGGTTEYARMRRGAA